MSAAPAAPAAGPRLRSRLTRTMSGRLSAMAAGAVQPATLAARSLSSHDVSLAVAVGCVGGTWPVFMTTWLVCALLGLALRLPTAAAAITQLVNCMLTPVELMLIPRYSVFGAALIGAPPGAGAFDVPALLKGLAKMPVATVVGAWPHLGRAVVGWAAVAPLLGTAVFFVVRAGLGGTKQELPQWSEGPPK